MTFLAKGYSTPPTAAETPATPAAGTDPGEVEAAAAAAAAPAPHTVEPNMTVVTRVKGPEPGEEHILRAYCLLRCFGAGYDTRKSVQERKHYKTVKVASFSEEAISMCPGYPPPPRPLFTLWPVCC